MKLQLKQGATHGLNKALKAHLRGDYTTALFRYAKLGKKYPRDHRVWYFGALCAYGAKDLTLAIDLMHNAIQLHPKHADAHYNLGKFCMDQGADAEAMECLLNAVELNPNHPEALNNLGNLYLHAGDLETAERCYTRSLAVRTTSPDALYNRSYLKLMKGDLRGGFTDYEARWQVPGYMLEYKRDFMTEKPRWTGRPLAGRRLFVVSEQGFGDTIQFLRYVPHLLKMVGPFHLEVQAQLRDLVAANVDPQVTLTSRGEPPPACDVWTSLMSLPALFQGILPPTPSPYLKPAAIERDEAPAGVRRVGLCWAGSPGHKNDHNRSLRFSEVAPLASVPNVQWYSLQIGDREAEAAGAPWLTLAGDRWRTFAASACFVAGLDLVITCDSAVAHLAGALGVPTWVMVPKVPDFRWQLDRSDCPWYPTMRLYRQTMARQWADVIARVCADLGGTPIHPQLELPEASGYSWEQLRAQWVEGDPYQPEDGTERYYQVKAQVAAFVQPRRVVEIGVRAGYSAHAFHMGHPYAEFHGIDQDEGRYGGVRGYADHARARLASLPGVQSTLQIQDSQTTETLPESARGADLFHVDGDHSTKGCVHDILLALSQGARWILVDDYDFIHQVRAAADWVVQRRGLTAYYVGDGGYRGNLLIRGHP